MDNQEYRNVPNHGEEALDQSDHPMTELLRQEFAHVIPQHGETLEGTIVDINANEVVVDIGCKSEGIVPARDLERMDPELLRELAIGDTVFVYVVRSQDAGRSFGAQTRPERQSHTALVEAGGALLSFTLAGLGGDIK